MNETQMRAELIRIIENNNQFTAWTVSTPHIMMLIDKAVQEALEKASERAWLALVGKGQDWKVRQAVSEAIRGQQ